jgi:hypothetical protein
MISKIKKVILIYDCEYLEEEVEVEITDNIVLSEYTRGLDVIAEVYCSCMRLHKFILKKEER